MIRKLIAAGFAAAMLGAVAGCENRDHTVDPDLHRTETATERANGPTDSDRLRGATADLSGTIGGTGEVSRPAGSTRNAGGIANEREMMADGAKADGGVRTMDGGLHH